MNAQESRRLFIAGSAALLLDAACNSSPKPIPPTPEAIIAPTPPIIPTIAPRPTLIPASPTPDRNEALVAQYEQHIMSEARKLAKPNENEIELWKKAQETYRVTQSLPSDKKLEQRILQAYGVLKNSANPAFGNIYQYIFERGINLNTTHGEGIDVYPISQGNTLKWQILFSQNWVNSLTTSEVFPFEIIRQAKKILKYEQLDPTPKATNISGEERFNRLMTKLTPEARFSLEKTNFEETSNLYLEFRGMTDNKIQTSKDPNYLHDIATWVIFGRNPNSNGWNTYFSRNIAPYSSQGFRT